MERPRAKTATLRERLSDYCSLLASATPPRTRCCPLTMLPWAGPCPDTARRGPPGRPCGRPGAWAAWAAFSSVAQVALWPCRARALLLPSEPCRFAPRASRRLVAQRSSDYGVSPCPARKWATGEHGAMAAATSPRPRRFLLLYSGKPSRASSRPCSLSIAPANVASLPGHALVRHRLFGAPALSSIFI